MSPRPRSVLALAALTAFLDLVGFSIIFPLFPQMLDHYLALEGRQSAIGALASTLQGWAGDRSGAAFLVVVLFGGVLGSVYSLLQFLFAPVWGALSDRIGRRPTLMITLAGTVFGYLGWVFAGTFFTLVISRLVGGMMAGNLSTVSAAVADVTTPSERSKGMGIVGAAIGIGFIVGPAIGGASTLWLLAPTAAQGVADPAALALNPFSSAAIASLVLAVLNLVLAAARFPETLPPERRGQHTAVRTANPLKLFRGINAPGVQRVNLLSFLFLTAFSAMEFSLTFLTVERFKFGPRDNAMLFVGIGLIIAVVQGVIVRRAAPRYGDRRVAFVGLALLLPGFLAVGFATGIGLLWLGLAFLAIGSALANPCLSALLSQYSPPDQQGLALGIYRSLGALSRAVGPVAGGLLYWRYGSTSPYLAGALLVLIPVAIAVGLPVPISELHPEGPSIRTG